jgi:signal transduction histidine kinase
MDPNVSPRFPAWILESMSSGIAAIDCDGAVVTLNAGARRILGCADLPPERAIGRHCRDVLAGQPGVVRLLLEALERKGPLSRAELPLESGAAARAIGFTLCPVRDGSDRLRGAAMIFRDLAPIERGDEQERLHERLAALGQMAAGLAHQIRNPLAGMEVWVGLLRRRLADRPEVQELVDELALELRAVAATVSASLEFVRPAAPHPVRVDPVRLMEEALATALVRVPFSGTVERRFEPQLPPLEADAEQLRAALADLVVNALEAMADGRGSRLAVSVRARDADPEATPVRVGADGAARAGPPREIVFEVADDGPGVAPELREKVFYPFFTTKQRGSGVGLAMAQKIAVAHGGSLELDSGPARGCAATVRLPAASGMA